MEPAAGSGPAGLGQSLRARLLEAIESLGPGDGRPGRGRFGRGYEILRLRYVEGQEPSDVQNRLSIGKSQYYLDHAQAVHAVVSLLEPAVAAQPPVPPASIAALPRPLAGFIGRESELAAIMNMLLRRDQAVRLLTLVGPPGTGKTRLAQEAAARLASTYGWDRIRFVDLTPLQEPAPALALVAQALGAETLADLALEATASVLLVLDNCEQVRHLAPQLAALVRTHSGLQVVATSRVPLDVYGERHFRVPPLSLPASTAHLAEAARSEAVRLFLERAQAIGQDLTLTERNVGAIVDISGWLRPGQHDLSERDGSRVPVHARRQYLFGHGNRPSGQHGYRLDQLHAGGEVSRPVHAERALRAKLGQVSGATARRAGQG